jgi:serpin B
MSNNTNTQIDLIKELDKNKQSENIVFSPIGIEMVLSLLSNGAEGRTQKEILDFLNYKSLEEANEKSKEIKDALEKNSEIIKMANAILTKEKAKEPFIKTGKEKYDANIEVLDNYRNVNEWARNKTKNNINKIIDSIHPDVIMVLLNALYFEAFWEIKFDQNDSKFQPFYNLEEEKNKVNITMMILRGTLLNYYENDYFQAVKLNYQKPGSFNSIIILPKKDYGIRELFTYIAKKQTGRDDFRFIDNQEELNIQGNIKDSNNSGKKNIGKSMSVKLIATKDNNNNNKNKCC